MSTFKKGDKVKWESQSGGHTKQKVGIVISAVKPNQNQNNQCPFGYNNRRFVDSTPRDHRSYLVRIGRSCQLNWPLVKHLRKA